MGNLPRCGFLAHRARRWARLPGCQAPLLVLVCHQVCHGIGRTGCSHIDEPLHSLHWMRWRPCSHIDEPLGMLNNRGAPAVVVGEGVVRVWWRCGEGVVRVWWQCGEGVVRVW